ncbi:C2 family cysteine protease [Parendozoicomonas sp. Alg238-R29]|uniref:C2 family cysteine protease n=1 Tax=Parendozoicomonas sp. Alg238-R29 TaxID=2993446 RepID=UPI00248EF4B2|nr:C2 family cysteine protease [Parendozoicomonas sp. Alg238-R29]
MSAFEFIGDGTGSTANSSKKAVAAMRRKLTECSTVDRCLEGNLAAPESASKPIRFRGVQHLHHFNLGNFFKTDLPGTVKGSEYASLPRPVSQPKSLPVATELPKSPVGQEQAVCGAEAVEPEIVSIAVSDQQLQQDWKDARYPAGREGDYQYTGENPLFPTEPLPVDVQQSYNRNTCYMMAALAAYASCPAGRVALKSMIQYDRVPGNVTVRFYDKQINKTVDVSISQRLLVNRRGEHLYSFHTGKNCIWPALFEKAYHAFLYQRRECLEACLSGTDDAGDVEVKAALSHLVVRPDLGLLDQGELLQGLEVLLPVAISYDDHNERRSKYAVTIDGCEFAQHLDYLRRNIELGVPVVMGTDKNMKAKGQALLKGMATGHAYGVIGPARVQSQDGFLFFDPYGSARENVEWLKDVVLAEQEHSFQVKSAGGAVAFVSWDEVSSMFCKAAICAGGIQLRTDSDSKEKIVSHQASPEIAETQL